MKKWWKDPYQKMVVTNKIRDTLTSQKKPIKIRSFSRVFARKYTKTPDGCFIFTGCKRRGYGVLSYQQRTFQAHRLAYILSKGQIINPFEIVLHTCHNRSCINPDHLTLGSHFELHKLGLPRLYKQSTP